MVAEGVGTLSSAADAAGCAALFAEFARTAKPRAPLYHRLATGIAADPVLAGLLLSAPPMQRQPVLLFACVHDLLLAGRPDVGLARYYPDLAAQPDDGDPMPAFRAFVATQADELAELLVTRSTQTNEIGRCALLVPAFGIVAAEVGPLAHVDVGASAGLNLMLDRYQYGTRREASWAVRRPSRCAAIHEGASSSPPRCRASSSGSGSTARPWTSTTTRRRAG